MRFSLYLSVILLRSVSCVFTIKIGLDWIGMTANWQLVGWWCEWQTTVVGDVIEWTSSSSSSLRVVVAGVQLWSSTTALSPAGSSAAGSRRQPVRLQPVLSLNTAPYHRSTTFSDKPEHCSPLADSCQRRLRYVDYSDPPPPPVYSGF